MIRAGLLGFGVAGRYFHAPLLRAANIDVVAVVSSQREAIATALPRAAALGTADELFARGDVDLVVIATPTPLHEQQARAALAAGKHVVVDKPLCTRASDVDALAALARRQRRMLTVFHNRRWDSDFLTIKKLLAEGRLGAVTAFHARWDRYRPSVVDRWREHDQPGSGLLYDLGSHLIDQVLQLFGMPDWIHADVFTQRPGAAAVDGFAIQMAAGAMRISIGASSLVADNALRYAVHGMQGSYVKQGLDVQEPQLRAGMLPTDAQFGIEPESQWGRCTEGASGRSALVPAERGRWTDFYSQVRACIENGAPPPVTAESARDVIHVIETAVQSSESGRRIALATHF